MCITHLTTHTYCLHVLIKQHPCPRGAYSLIQTPSISKSCPRFRSLVETKAGTCGCSTSTEEETENPLLGKLTTDSSGSIIIKPSSSSSTTESKEVILGKISKENISSQGENLGGGIVKFLHSINNGECLKRGKALDGKRYWVSDIEVIRISKDEKNQVVKQRGHRHRLENLAKRQKDFNLIEIQARKSPVQSVYDHLVKPVLTSPILSTLKSYFSKSPSPTLQPPPQLRPQIKAPELKPNPPSKKKANQKKKRKGEKKSTFSRLQTYLRNHPNHLLHLEKQIHTHRTLLSSLHHTKIFFHTLIPIPSPPSRPPPPPPLSSSLSAFSILITLPKQACEKTPEKRALVRVNPKFLFKSRVWKVKKMGFSHEGDKEPKRVEVRRRRRWEERVDFVLIHRLGVVREGWKRESGMGRRKVNVDVELVARKLARGVLERRLRGWRQRNGRISGGRS